MIKTAKIEMKCKNTCFADGNMSMTFFSKYDIQPIIVGTEKYIFYIFFLNNINILKKKKRRRGFFFEYFAVVYKMHKIDAYFPSVKPIFKAFSRSIRFT